MVKKNNIRNPETRIQDQSTLAMISMAANAIDLK
jgi:hypothetical protein